MEMVQVNTTEENSSIFCLTQMH